MAIYSFSIRRHIRDDMYKNETIEVELTDAEAKSLNNDDGKYSKTSKFLSKKLGENVQSNGLLRKAGSENTSKKESEKEKSNKKSIWKPWWAIPFKILWWLIKLPFKLLLSK